LLQKHRDITRDSMTKMASVHDNRRDHVLRGPLERAVREAQKKNSDAKSLVEAILNELDEQNIIAYTPKSKVNLLTPQGRVLVFLVERPRMTVREISVSLGVSIQSANKAISLLAKDKLITRTKVKGRYEYRINLENVRYHPDMRRLINTVKQAIDEID
jgi:Mn-dependent DtxR family transcriptional regulator